MIVFGSRMNTPTDLDAGKPGYLSNSWRDSKAIGGQASDLVDLGLRDSASSRPLERDTNLPNFPSELSGAASAITTNPKATISPFERLSFWFSLDKLSLYFTVIWMSGVVLTLLPLLIGQRYIRRIMLCAEEITDPEIRIELRRTSEKFGTYCKVLLLHSPAISMPVTFGILKPLIVLPSNWRTWPQGACQAALLHEYAHVQRRDVAWQLLARVTCAIYWFHPLAWYAASRLRIERELACDDFVLTTGQSATEYASHLVSIAKACHERTPEPGLAMAQVNGLEKRIRAILDHSRSHDPVSRTLSAIFLLIALVVGVPLMIVQASIESVNDANLVENANSNFQNTAKDDSSLEIAVPLWGPMGSQYRERSYMCCMSVLGVRMLRRLPSLPQLVNRTVVFPFESTPTITMEMMVGGLKHIL